MEAYDEWPRDGLSKILDQVNWDRPLPVHKRGFRLTVTECIQEGIRDANIDLIEILDAWKKIYKAVANIAEAGYLHRDLSFGNVRVRRISGNEIIVKLIDFDLVDEIESLDSAKTAPDRTGTILFIPIDILKKTKPPRRQEQHEDETAFWVGYWLCLSAFSEVMMPNNSGLKRPPGHYLISKESLLQILLV